MLRDTFLTSLSFYKSTYLCLCILLLSKCVCTGAEVGSNIKESYQDLKSMQSIIKDRNANYSLKDSGPLVENIQIPIMAKYSQMDTKIVNANFHEQYTYLNVNLSSQILFIYSYTEQENQVRPIY